METLITNFEKICLYIEILHSVGIVHGDIKEDNFILTESDLYIIDFGSSFDVNFINDHRVKWRPCCAAMEDYFMTKDETYITKSTDWNNFLAICQKMFNIEFVGIDIKDTVSAAKKYQKDNQRKFK